MPEVLPFDARRFLEPACGSGRLITELAARGYQVTGFDLSQPGPRQYRRRATGRINLYIPSAATRVPDVASKRA